MVRGQGSWSYDAQIGAWYFRLNERAAPPYIRQEFVQAIIDIDADGRLAGIELLDRIDGQYIQPPLSVKLENK